MCVCTDQAHLRQPAVAETEKIERPDLQWLGILVFAVHIELMIPFLS